MSELARFFKDGQLQQIPRKEKNKRLIFDHLYSKFEFDKDYLEKEVNAILKSIYPDHAILRRYLVDYHYLDREKDGSIYKKAVRETEPNT
ncbi:MULTISPECIES: DUF2087 domain-containing protein [Enterococcus]|uniref:DUF2087 domain-containing protein n=1 Tax=Enterococcus TaxID=1350 RepID=UPI00031D68A4|nr:DUF2087 domain-containing protein [Enterococcus mundtii]MBO1085610.1 DUF2087 domain-containing protein [Enterococcus mundtii]MDV7745891.1 DUF2087 domain-containing protein [Enterococcus mundtii]PQC29618.1 DUF2087 domain-containing protein [Enterococcus mundtii]